MREHSHRRSRRARRLTAVVAATALGAGGIAMLGVSASAGPDGGTGAASDAASGAAGEPDPSQGGQGTAAAYTIACPDVGQKLDRVPDGVRTDVARRLTELDAQVARAYQQLTENGGEGGNTNRSDTVLRTLREQRAGTIDRIADTIGRGGAPRPDALTRMSGCDMKQDERASADTRAGDGPEDANAGSDGNDGQDQQGQGEDPGQGENQGQDGGQGQDPGQGAQGGPVAADFTDIRAVQPNVRKPAQQPDASRGTFTSRCGRNENGHFNSDNVIAAPGVRNGAHHVHDYVGNNSTDGFSTDESLAAADTTCTNGDLSTHYWPVLRALDGKQEGGHQPGGAHDGNVGSVLRPASASLTFKGSPVGKVAGMPRFLRIITGDAKAFTNGTANANASWSCEGFENRQLTDKYPLCPEGSRVVRTFDFQSCWDGENTDSGNHRDHVAFAREDGSCPDGFRAVPQLQQRITYDVPREGVPADTPFAVDSFPEQLHKPVTDHGDFINVMPDRLMREAVDCINGGRKCG